MPINKYIITSVFGIIEALSCGSTNLLRAITLNDIARNKFILGIMPHISEYCFFYMGWGIVVNKINNNFSFKVASIISWVIFLLAIIYELMHDRFLNSHFDMNDIITTILAIIVYLISFYIAKYKVKINEQC